MSIRFCPVEHRDMSEDYCDSINCDMCPEGTCLGFDPQDEDNTDVAMDPSLIA